MPNEKNKQIVENIKEKLNKSTSVTFADYLGLTSEQMNKLRQDVKNNDAEAVILKNTLLKVAIDEQGDKNIAKAKKDLQGPTMAIFSFSDPIAPIKALFNMAKDVELPKVKSAIIEGIYKDEKDILIIKDIPSREELIARIVGSLSLPVSGLVNTLGGVQRKFVYAINAIAQKQETEGGVR